MFFPVQAKDGKQAYLNLTQVFAFVDMGASTVAISMGGTSFEIPEKCDTVMKELEDFMEGEDE